MSQRRKAVSTLFIAPKGAVSEALRGVLQSIPEIDVVSTVKRFRPAAQAIQERALDLVVISDQVLAEDILALIAISALTRHRPRVIVLATSPTQERRFLDSGGFAVIRSWDSLDRLRAIIRSDLVVHGE